MPHEIEITQLCISHTDYIVTEMLDSKKMYDILAKFVVDYQLSADVEQTLQGMVDNICEELYESLKNEEFTQ